MSAPQKWLFYCAACLSAAWLLGVPASELRPVAWVLSSVCSVGLLVDVVTMALEATS